jgi:hypothetical protein
MGLKNLKWVTHLMTFILKINDIYQLSYGNSTQCDECAEQHLAARAHKDGEEQGPAWRPKHVAMHQLPAKFLLCILLQLLGRDGL